MEHKGTVRIETERLVLRRFTSKDREPAFRNWMSDPEVTRFLSWPTHEDVFVSRTVIDSWVKSYSDPAYYSWAIELKEIKEPIGSIAAVRLDEKTDSVEIGYCMGKKWWGNGIMSEALSALIGFFIDEVRVKRIEARHDVNNGASGAVMRKCGMTFEGMLRNAGRNNSGICTLCVYSFLPSDRR